MRCSTEPAPCTNSVFLRIRSRAQRSIQLLKITQYFTHVRHPLYTLVPVVEYSASVSRRKSNGCRGPHALILRTMVFTERLRPLVRAGKVTCSVRIWKQPRVKVGGRYALPPGEIEVTAIRGITTEDISERLARRSGFDSVDDLLAVARHGAGELIFLVEFVYHPPSDTVSGRRASRSPVRPGRGTTRPRASNRGRDS